MEECRGYANENMQPKTDEQRQHCLAMSLHKDDRLKPSIGVRLITPRGTGTRTKGATGKN